MGSLLTIFKYLRKYPRLVVLYFSSNILSSLFGVISLALVSPFLMVLFRQGDAFAVLPQKGISAFNPLNYLKLRLYEIISVPGGNVRALLIICIVVFVAIVLKNLFTYLSMYILNPIRNGILNDMRSGMYGRIMILPVGYFSEQKKGEIMSKLSNDLGDVEASTISVLETIFKEPITILFYFVYLIILSPHLTFFLILFIPVSGFILGRIGRSLKKENKKVMQQFGILFSTIEETISGIRIIKAFNAEKKIMDRFESQNREMFHLKNKANRRRDLASPLSEAMGVTAVLFILWYGGKMVLQHHSAFSLNAGDFIAYIAIFSQLIQPLKALSGASYNIQKGAASVERIEALIHEEVSIKEKEDPVMLRSFRDSIEFRNVSFRYADTWVLRHIDLKIEKGKTIAIVGSSGSGKSTLVDLIPRFIDATEGSVLIDGIDVREYSLASIRSALGIVTQEPILFNDSIENNIALGKKGASSSEIEQAAVVANAHSFIVQKESGYQTNIGERGTKLSGGERQRLTIARAVLKDPDILLLDEATSALDTESERLVQNAINNLTTDRTSVVIAHRLSTIRHADEIIVMQKGVLAERGTHEQLVAINGIYRRLVDMQELV
jgi:subfamily B ATP-binding cassette protein MsbA